MGFAVGNTVTWASQASGTQKQKTGKVVCVVPRGCPPNRLPSGHRGGEWGEKLDAPGLSRDHVSYVVLVGKSKVYWPRVSGLTLVQ